MKQLPNICTLGNLFCGCIAITYILTAPAFMTTTTGSDFYPVMGVNRMAVGSIFILIAAVFDMFDGTIARALKVHSDIGRDLDSLADVVSFGVAPSMVMYQLLWKSYMALPRALDTPMYVMAPAFLLACFGALRLARFNQSGGKQSRYFSGMPIPATGIFVASLPLVDFYDASRIYQYTGLDLTHIIENKWVLYGLIALLCWFMVSDLKFLKWKAPKAGITGWWPHLLIAIVVVITYPFIQFASLLLGFILYIISSLIYQYPPISQEHLTTNNQ